MGISIINLDNKKVFACKIPSNYIENDKNKKNIGKKIEDFTILQVMGEGAFGFVAKVKSKINHEIYALKKNIINNMTEEERKKMKNEIIFLKYLNHPNVCSCLTSFNEDDCFYFVMKLFNNKDLFKFLSAYMRLKVQIKEEVLWDFFYQCLEGLTYIHNQGIIHRDIKLANLLMDDQGKIIIGDFGVSAVMNEDEANKFIKDEKDDEIKNSLIMNLNEQAGTPYYMAPEIEHKKKYDQKADVYSMGICFYALCFFGLPYVNDGNMDKLKSDRYYSNELKDTIRRMIEINPIQRPTSFEIFRIFKKYYMKKYMKNSGIYSVVRCLFSFPNFSSYFNNQMKLSNIIDSKYVKKVALIMIAINNSFKDKTNIEENIFDLRKLLDEEGIKEKDNNEILPSSVINIILNSLNYELNEIPPIEGSFNSTKLVAQFSQGQEKQKYNEFIDYYKRNFKSIISKDFFGVLKNTRVCNECNSSFSTFEKFHYINFNLTFFGNILDNTTINIFHLIDYMNKTNITLDKNHYISCSSCKTFTNHKESKKIYDIKKNLIIIFNRGNKNQSKIKIDFSEKLKFKKKFVENISNKEYTLVGIITELNNKYISFVKNKENGWICYNIDGDANGKMIQNFDDIKNYGNLMSLFYYDFGFEKLFDSININMNSKDNGDMNELNINKGILSKSMNFMGNNMSNGMYNEGNITNNNNMPNRMKNINNNIFNNVNGMNNNMNNCMNNMNNMNNNMGNNTNNNMYNNMNNIMNNNRDNYFGNINNSLRNSCNINNNVSNNNINNNAIIKRTNFVVFPF